MLRQQWAAIFEKEYKSDGRLFILALKKGEIQQHVKDKV